MRNPFNNKWFNNRWFNNSIFAIALTILWCISATGTAGGSLIIKSALHKAVGNFNNYKAAKAHAAIKREPEGHLRVHFIDVGDADAILIQQGGHSMLIDAGNDKDSYAIVEYIKRLGISKLQILVATHGHEDHIGSMDSVIDSFDIDTIYMPRHHITNKYIEDVLRAVDRKAMQITEPAAGESFKLGDAVCTILAPISGGYEEVNDYSIVIKLQYGGTSFLFNGDAESYSEKEMMRRGYDLSADVLKLAHHGSISSTSKEFLERVNPQYAVIMAGRNNGFRHPHKRTLSKLKDKGIKVYRTDESGTIIADSDGKNIIFNKKAGNYFGR